MMSRKTRQIMNKYNIKDSDFDKVELDSKLVQEFKKEEIDVEIHKLTPKQIKNWRRILISLIGPYALLLPEFQIQEYRNKLQNRINIIK